MIPKIIHQTWKNNNIPNHWQRAQKTIIEFHNGFKYILWTDDAIDNFIQTLYPDFIELFQSYKYKIQRVDAFRYFVLYHYGGVYVDLDIGCNSTTGCFQNFMNNDVVLFKNYSPIDNFTNAIMMSEKAHPFMLFCINNLEMYQTQFWYLGKHLNVIYSTGPGFLTSMYEIYTNKYNNHSFQEVSKNAFGNCNICNMSKGSCTSNLLFLTDGRSWNSFDSNIFNFCYCNRKTLTFCVCVILLLMIIKQMNVIQYKQYVKRFR